jgi:hypothetical protein
MFNPPARDVALDGFPWKTSTPQVGKRIDMDGRHLAALNLRMRASRHGVSLSVTIPRKGGYYGGKL